MASKLPVQSNAKRLTPLRIIALVVLGITALCIFNPFTPVMPSSIPLDPSWVIGLNQAAAQNLQFGKDLIFTFGPYAAVYTKAFHPGTAQLELIGSLYLGLLYAVALLSVVKRTSIWILVGLGILLSGLTTHLDSIFYSYALLTAIYCWQSISKSSDAFSQKDSVGLLLLALFFSGFGLYPLIKGPHFVLYFPVAILTITLLAWHRKWLAVMIVPTATGLSMAGFWLYAKQDLATLPNYFYSLSILISGFAPAMSSPGNSWEVFTYICAAFLILVYILRKEKYEVKGVYLFLVFFLYLFVAFKAGFVRHDGHALMSGSALMLASLLIAAILPSRSSLILLALSSAIFFNIAHHYHPLSLQEITQKITRTYLNPWNGLQIRVKHPDQIKEQFHQTLAALAKSNPLPKLSGTTDIYPFDQTDLIASGNTWNPRPIFQSYHAYTKTLAEINRDFLMKPGSPDHLFFRIESIDERLPSTDDGASWPMLLTQYHPEGWAGKYLVLNKNPAPSAPQALSTLSTNSYPVIDWVELPASKELLYASIDIELSWLGRLKNMVYKTSPLGIGLRLEDGSVKQFRLIPGNVSSNFLLSPLIENTEAFSQLYLTPLGLQQKRVRAISVWVEGNPRDWQKTYQLTLKTSPQQQ